VVKTVVVPTDGSEFSTRSVPVALTLAERFDASVLFVLAGLGGNPDSDQRRVAALDEQASDRGVPSRVEVIRDRFAENAIAGVLRQTVDPVACMASHGRSGVGQVLLGSVAEDAVRISGTPFALVGPDCDTAASFAGGPLVMGHDGSAVADEIVPVVARWATALDLPVVVVEVQDDDAAVQAPSRAVVAAAGQLKDLRVAVEIETLAGGEPAEAILGLADRRSASLVALSTHGRTGLDRMTLGSVAASIVHASRCPVLVQRPRDLRL
jgi:nucleotide-binding universal stress UspA family protein